MSAAHLASRWRRTLVVALAAITAIAATGCKAQRDAAPAGATPVIVLGFDGMDYALTKRLLDAGRLPNLQRLAQSGGFAPLETTVPPQSPVAWSSFITGLDAGGHGIFDFIHRDPATMLPYLSTTKTEDGESVRLGRWRVPLSGGEVVLLRHGTAFWETLARRGIETTIVRSPANFPPGGSARHELSGMGTPDLLGTYGTFTFFTGDDTAAPEAAVSGGRIVAGKPQNGVFRGALQGPSNPFRADAEPTTTGFELHFDPERSLALLVAGKEERILRQGDWSDWVPVEFELAPTRKLHGMCRFYLKQIRPTFELYVTPINLDPMQPALPISKPASWARDLAQATGRYYTQGMPEDTKAYSSGVFDAEDFLAQAHLAGQENLDQYRYVLGSFRAGLLFYYFGNLDLVSHMMWRSMDPDHPAYDATFDAPFADVMPQLYERMDGVVGWTLDHMPPGTLLVVMSDHGFTSWRRSFNLNTWLQRNGYLAVRDSATTPAGDANTALANLDWQRTRAYALGLNGLYLNLQGRERWGIVATAERDALLDEIAARLAATIDPATGQPAVSRVHRSDRTYTDHDQLEVGPDLVIGYAKGTRSSDESALGLIEPEVFADNRGAWSGDHCMDHTTVPGILFTNRALRRPTGRLQDLGISILAEFGIDRDRAPDATSRR